MRIIAKPILEYEVSIVFNYIELLQLSEVCKHRTGVVSAVFPASDDAGAAKLEGFLTSFGKLITKNLEAFKEAQDVLDSL